MLPLLEQVEASISARRLLSRGQRVLVAVSGGVDSVVLLRILAELAPAHGWKITLAHLNHQLRGPASQADQRLVQRTARQLKLPLILSHADVRAHARKQGLSMEMAARQLRHVFLARTARQKRISCVALAHHRDDQVELFFLRLFRGAGIEGLAGMKWRSASPADLAVDLIRPLLDIPKTDLLEYATDNDIAFRQDATNDDIDIQRNRIRHELLPLLERKYQPDLRGKIGRLMDLLGAESTFVDSVARAWLAANPACQQCQPLPTDFHQIDAASLGQIAGTEELSGSGACFDALPIAVQRRCLQHQVIRLGIQPSYSIIERLRLHPEKPFTVGRQNPTFADGVAGAASDSSVARPGDLVREGSGVVRLIETDRPGFQADSRELELRNGEGRVKWDGVELVWRVLSGPGARRKDRKPGGEFFDADAVGRVVRLRHWRPGDRFQPIGMAKPAKLQDLFVNQKVARATRHRLLVATTAAGQIFWVEGLRISDRFKLTSSTIRRLHWRWQRL